MDYEKICDECYLHIEKKEYDMFLQKIMPAVNAGFARAEYMLGTAYYYGDCGVEKDMSKYFEYIKKSADKGYNVALYELGRCYKYGIVVDKDVFRGISLIMQSAEMGYVKAQKSMALFYDLGDGVKKDEKKAFEWYSKAADNGDENSLYNVALAYRDGKAVKKDYQKYKTILTSMASKGMALGYYELGNLYYFGTEEKTDLEKSAMYYQLASNKGDKYAQYRLGEFYYKGIYFDVDYNMAFEYFEQSAKQDSQMALFMLGECYFYGKGVDCDYELAIFWYKKAAEKGHADADKKIKECKKHLKDIFDEYPVIHNRRDGMKPLEEILSIFDDAELKIVQEHLAKQGGAYQKTINSSANINQTQNSSSYNSNLASDSAGGLTEYQKAYKAGYANIDKTKSSSVYINSFNPFSNIPENFDDGLKYQDFKKVPPLNYKNLPDLYGDNKNDNRLVRGDRCEAYEGNKMCQYNLGMYYLNGENGVPQDIDYAIFWLTLSAQQGYAFADYELGRCYENGIGVNKDINMAISLYQRASKKWHSKAKEALKRLT